MRKLFLILALILVCSQLGLAQDSTQTARKVVVGVSNASSTGTTLNRLAKLTGAPSKAVLVGDADTDGALGVVLSNAGTTGVATIQTSGIVPCVFDSATTAGDYVSIAATGGRCHDTGAATYPLSGQVLGRVLSTNVGAGTYSILLTPGVKAVSGITNSAGANVIPKSNGPNLVASNLTDNGTAASMASGTSGAIVSVSGSATIVDGTTVDIGDTGGEGHGVRITLNDTAQTIAIGKAGTTVTVAGVKRYVALLSQSGTDAPVATVLENSLGGAIVWTRTDVGEYRGTLTGAFPTLSKTFFVPQRPYIPQLETHGVLAWASVNAINLTIGGDDMMDGGLMIEIRVYP
jgi:hypothetical protein